MGATSLGTLANIGSLMTAGVLGIFTDLLD
jgi:hypothetical protein